MIAARDDGVVFERSITTNDAATSHGAGAGGDSRAALQPADRGRLRPLDPAVHCVPWPAASPRLGAPEISAFVSWLAVKQGVAASTQNQVRSAVLFLYRDVLRQKVGTVELLPRARMPSRVPVVLTVAEVRKVLDALAGVPRIVAMLLYGAGLRLQESLELRVKDLDFERQEITGRPGKGQKDRRVMLPDASRDALQHHLEGVRRIHHADLAAAP